ncbi:hypothetical protein [Flexibacterium corallicola]|uniref:hypothetical protein n=1 Tax=Flexibacterium corallicola TaxID=3037259 RepID=UPI00286F5B20|nr:hypothetical protein [Pseudovibrio sp. M1P-2-3]
MRAKTIKILVLIDFPDEPVRLWSGSGPYIDADGAHWRGAGELPQQALQQLEYAFAGEAVQMDFAMSGIPQDIAQIGFEETKKKDLIGSKFQVLLQDCDGYHQPLETSPKVVFTGRVADFRFKDKVGDVGPIYELIMSVANRNLRRRMTDGSVLSDINQRSRASLLNPHAPSDKFCERVPLLADQTIVWPRF